MRTPCPESCSFVFMINYQSRTCRNTRHRFATAHLLKQQLGAVVCFQVVEDPSQLVHGLLALRANDQSPVKVLARSLQVAAHVLELSKPDEAIVIYRVGRKHLRKRSMITFQAETV